MKTITLRSLLAGTLREEPADIPARLAAALLAAAVAAAPLAPHLAADHVAPPRHDLHGHLSIFVRVEAEAESSILDSDRVIVDDGLEIMQREVMVRTPFSEQVLEPERPGGSEAEPLGSLARVAPEGADGAGHPLRRRA